MGSTSAVDLGGGPQVDLHGQHVKQAIEIIEQLVVVPMLPAVRDFTGRGVHSSVSGTSALRTALLEYLSKLEKSSY